MASVVVTMDAREAQLFRAQQKIIDQQVKLNAKFAEGGKASEKAGKQTTDAFGKSSLSIGKMKEATLQYVAGLATVTTGVMAIKAAWELVRKEQEAGLNQLQRTSGQDRRLLQIAGSKEDFEQLRGQADVLASQFGVDRGVVREVIFSAVSENFRDAVPAIIAASQVVDPMSAAGVAGQIPALFKGSVSPLEAVDLTLRAAKESRLDFAQIAESLPQAAEGGGVAKATVEETLSVLSVLASEFKTGQTAADRIKGFATKAGITEGYKDIGIVAVVEKLQAMDAAGRSEFLKDSQELNVAYVKMSENMDLIKKRIADITAERAAFASGGGILRSQTEIALGDPQLAAVRAEARARQELESTQAQINGVTGGAAGSASLKTEQRLLQGGNFFQRLLNDFTGFQSGTARAAVTFGFSADSASALGVAAGDIVESAKFGPAAGVELMYKAAQRMLSSSEKLDDAAGKLNTGNQAARAQAAGAAN